MVRNGKSKTVMRTTVEHTSPSLQSSISGLRTKEENLGLKRQQLHTLPLKQVCNHKLHSQADAGKLHVS